MSYISGKCPALGSLKLPDLSLRVVVSVSRSHCLAISGEFTMPSRRFWESFSEGKPAILKVDSRFLPRNNPHFRWPCVFSLPFFTPAFLTGEWGILGHRPHPSGCAGPRHFHDRNHFPSPSLPVFISRHGCFSVLPCVLQIGSKFGK